MELTGKKKKDFKKILLFITLAIAVVFSFLYLSQGTSTDSPTSAEEVVERAPDVLLTDFDGSGTRLSNYRGTPVFLDFWAAWCPFCLKDMPEIQLIHEEMGDRLVVLGVHRTKTESMSQGAKFAAERGVTYTLIQDPGDELYREFLRGYSSMPLGVFIDGEGNIVERVIGPKTADQMREILSRLVQ